MKMRVLLYGFCVAVLLSGVSAILWINLIRGGDPVSETGTIEFPLVDSAEPERVIESSNEFKRGLLENALTHPEELEVSGGEDLVSADRNSENSAAGTTEAGHPMRTHYNAESSDVQPEPEAVAEDSVQRRAPEEVRADWIAYLSGYQSLRRPEVRDPDSDQNRATIRRLAEMRNRRLDEVKQ